MADSITPPPELVQQWAAASPLQIDDETYGYELFIAHHAAQWGADQELEACCEWLEDNAPAQQLLGHTWVDCEDPQETAKHLRATRRPKPPSLKEQALEELAEWENVMDIAPDSPIRRALEALPND